MQWQIAETLIRTVFILFVTFVIMFIVKLIALWEKIYNTGIAKPHQGKK